MVLNRHATATRALALVAVLILAACGQTPPPTPNGSAGKSVPASTATPDDTSCTRPFAGFPEPDFGYRHVEVPSGADRCYYSVSFDEREPWQLTNDGSIVAFNARNFGQQRRLWVGDLERGTVGLAYEAPQADGETVEVLYPQIAGGSLVWLENLHLGRDIKATLKEWSVKRMDLASAAVTTLVGGQGTQFGAKYVVDQMRYDGRRLAISEVDLEQHWQIEMIDLSGMSRSAIQVDHPVYALALVDGGLIYTDGTNDEIHHSMGLMHTYHWTKEGGSREISAGEYELAAEGTLLARISDPIASENLAGQPVEPRVLVDAPPYGKGTPISLVVDHNPSYGPRMFTVGSATVAWWEDEAIGEKPPFSVLTLWQRGWKTPVQVRTATDLAPLSVRGGWLVWFETGTDMMVRLRGVPLAAVVSQIQAAWIDGMTPPALRSGEWAVPTARLSPPGTAVLPCHLGAESPPTTLWAIEMPARVRRGQSKRRQ